MKDLNWTRKILLQDLRLFAETRTEDELLNYLNERGLVSDMALKMEHVPDGDLLRALNRLKRNEVPR